MDRDQVGATIPSSMIYHVWVIYLFYVVTQEQGGYKEKESDGQRIIDDHIILHTGEGF